MDLAGFEPSGFERVIEACKNVINCARQAGLRVIYLRQGYAPDLSDAGGQTSPNWHKELGLVLMRQRPELMGKLFVRGSWDAEIIEKIKPQQDDIVVWKQRYSGFVGTNLGLILKTHNIKHVVFIGKATNGCVDSTLRSAFFLDYFPILISDATQHIGPDICQEATIFIVKTIFGWVTDSKEFCKALGAKV